MKKQGYHHGNLKEELLKSAFEHIHNHDVEDLTLKILADKTGTSKSAIYRHFASKDDLIEKLIINGFEQFDNAISPILNDRTIPLVDRLYLAGKKYIEFAIENPNLYRLLFGRKFWHIREKIIDIKNSDSSGFGALRSAVEEGQKEGIVKDGDSFTFTVVVWSSLHGLSSLIINGFRNVKESYGEIYDEKFNAMLQGILQDGAKVVTRMEKLNRMLNGQG